MEFRNFSIILFFFLYLEVRKALCLYILELKKNSNQILGNINQCYYI